MLCNGFHYWKAFDLQYADGNKGGWNVRGISATLRMCACVGVRIGVVYQLFLFEVSRQSKVVTSSYKRCCFSYQLMLSQMYL